MYLVCRAENGKICAELYGRKSAYSYRRESVVTEVISPPEPEYAENENTKLRAAKDGLKSCGYLLTYKNGVIYAYQMAPDGSDVKIRSLAKQKKRDLLIRSVRLLGDDAALHFERTEEALVIPAAPRFRSDTPICFAIELL